MATTTATTNTARDRRVFAETLKEARIGVLDAQYELGLMYANGVGVAQDLEQALAWIRKAAERGMAAAQYLLGTRYATGSAVAKDERQAFHWFAKAAEQRHARAIWRLGRLHAGQHEELAAGCYAQAAELGLAPAQLALGEAYAAGQGVARDDALALHWLQQAAEQGLAAAQHALGDFHAQGRGVPQDADEAAFWYRRAAEQDHPAAHVALELMDHSADGRARKRGRGRGRAATTERRRGVERWINAADPGEADGRYHLGLMHERGLGIPADATRAEAWYRLAAQQNHTAAQAALGRLLENDGQAEALNWYGQAAERGDASAQFALGRLYSSAQLGAEDHFRGVAW